MTTECCICLDLIDSSKNYKCKKCKNLFHINCINSLHKKECPLCKEVICFPSEYNVYFNNMDENNIHNVDKYVKKFMDKGNNKCIALNHRLCVETLGDWSGSINSSNLIFKYKCMLVECTKCNISHIF